MIAQDDVENEKKEVLNACPYADVCGGCALASLSKEEYEDRKINRLREILTPLNPLPALETAFVPLQTRRRVTFGLFFNKVSRYFGLNERKSAKIVSIDSCALLTPALQTLIPALRSFFTDKTLPFFKREGTGDVSLTQTTTGTDMVVCLPFSPDLTWRQRLADFAVANSVARVSWKQKTHETPELLLSLAKPVVELGGFPVEIPSGCFLQPSVDGQNVLIEFVKKAVGKKVRNIADLFCGAGTFSLALLEKKRKIFAVDCVTEALNALFKASQGRIKVEERDLFKTPLLFDELNGFDAIVLDPPRAGAKAQCSRLIDSDVPVVVYVSCNPETFVADALVLEKGGFKMTDLQLVDQFVCSEHTELAARFQR